MPNQPEAAESLSTQQFFCDVFDEANGLVQRLDALRTRNRGNSGQIDIPHTNLALTQPFIIYEETGVEIQSAHVRRQGFRDPTLISVTTRYPDYDSDATPLSVGAYRENEEFPDYFIKQSPTSERIVCKLGIAGLRGEEPASDENIGESSLEPDTKIGELEQTDRKRIESVAYAIRNRVASITLIADMLADKEVKLVKYTGHEPEVVHYLPW